MGTAAPRPPVPDRPIACIDRHLNVSLKTLTAVKM